MLTPMWTRSRQTGRHIGHSPLFAVLAGLIGLFVSAATPVIIPAGTIPTTLASVALVMGTYNDTVLLQPL